MNKYKIICEYKDAPEMTFIVFVWASNTRQAIVKAIELYGINDLTHKLIACEMVLPYEFKKPLNILY